MPALSNEDKLRLLTILLESRHGDLREQNLNRQGKGHFHVSGMGHEGLAALGMQLRDGDYISGYYRDRALVLGRGVASPALLSASAPASTISRPEAHVSATPSLRAPQ